ncbi:MAG: NADH-quinone oxidoreductase subunit NuoF [bacterium]|nr:NADH-quinone oxidoreductase subunit NuoF [bacterium]
MARLSDENVKLAAEIIGRYPVARSALIPLLHVAQAQEGYVSDEAMEHVAELVGTTPSEVLSTCSFYEMFKRSAGGTYRVNICRGISCHLLGADELIEHASESLGVPVGGTTDDGAITLEAVECVAACTEAPCLQVNYRYVGGVGSEDFDRLVAGLRNGDHSDLPRHGTLATVRQRIPRDRAAGVSPPSAPGPPSWWERHQANGDGDAAGSLPEPAPAPPEEMIVTARCDLDDGHTLEGYLRTGGYAGLRRALDAPPAAVHAEVRAASLLGRGGAGFPAGVKWGFCPPNAWPRYLVVNGDESEPGTYKDRLLMERDPHQLIEGCLIACYALGLSQCFLYVRGEMALAAERLAAALNEAYAAGYVGSSVCGSDFGVDIVLHSGAGAYIVGEETALIESLEGNRGMPRLKPPFFPAAVGLYGRPTIVNNVETLSNLPWIVTHGATAFVGRGAEQSAGTRVFAVSGHVRTPGVFEVPFGVTTFREIICDERYGGGIRDGRDLKAFIPGGASAPWFTEEHLDLPLDKAAVDAAGSMLGSGAIVVMDSTTDIPRACHNLVRFFARESCGKCTPCREGTSWLEVILERILAGRGRPGDLDLLTDVCDNISPGLAWPPRMTTICPLGPSAASPIVSALGDFRHEFEAFLPRRIPVAAAPVAS